MDYNELKLPVLQLLSIHGAMNSGMLIKKLAESKGIILDIHALRMALMRYYKQGLLKRERSGECLHTQFLNVEFSGYDGLKDRSRSREISLEHLNPWTSFFQKSIQKIGHSNSTPDLRVFCRGH